MDDGPPDDAYGRVTNPERYRLLHEAALTIVEELSATYEVVITRGLDVDPELESHGVDLLDVIRLLPAVEGAAPLTVALTGFPAVLMRVGTWRQGAYPHCGCDACDEAPADAIAQLRQDVDNAVAGRITEDWDGERLHYAEWSTGDERSSGWSLIEGDRRKRYGAPRRYEWQPWRTKP
ncbi:MAG: DUF6226 family protein [Microthrixaceae bacterium]